MKPTPTPLDTLAVAEDRVANTKAELVAAREKAQDLRSSDHFLADCPELLNFYHLIRDHNRRQAQLERATVDLQQAREVQLREKASTNPFQAPARLKDSIERLQWLHEELPLTTDTGLHSPP